MTPEEHAQITEIAAEVRSIHELLEGHNGSLGMLQKVQIMWHAHVWLLCSVSAAFGSVLTLAIKLLIP